MCVSHVQSIGETRSEAQVHNSLLPILITLRYAINDAWMELHFSEYFA